MLALLVALFQVSTTPAPPRDVIFSSAAVGQMRFLYQHMRTEFAGCLYGRASATADTIVFFISGFIDPRHATDSTVHQGGCPLVRGEKLLALAHSHIRARAVCAPSALDLRALADWKAYRVLLGAIMCARGDSLVLYSVEGRGPIIAVPSLDSLYARP